MDKSIWIPLLMLCINRKCFSLDWAIDTPTRSSTVLK